MISVVSASLSRFGASAAQRDLRSHSQIGPSELIALTCFGGEEKRAGMINLYLKNKGCACDATWRQWSLECFNFEPLLALRFAPGCRIAMSFNWLMKTPFACSPCLCLHTHTSSLSHTRLSVLVASCVSSLLKHVHEIIPGPKVFTAGPVE